ncbi:nitroreductase [Pectobacterium carotovorum]|uniref:nitroreductase n=1 Tax=Pectobacterium carotovorum TaxID=554 RepID=UPI00027E0C7F|nr:nitroreductase [Pectobacterium carotovorum]AFR02768.1 nitroreductase [Pectobacterium carotovorum subsp. carotovorum PCC21]
MTMPFNVKADLLNQRYGQQQKPKNFHWTPEIVTMMSHRSVRAFLPKPLAEGVIETMVAAAQSASSLWCLASMERHRCHRSRVKTAPCGHNRTDGANGSHSLD